MQLVRNMKKRSKNLPTDDILYLDVTQAIVIHEQMMNIGGGREGIRDFTLIHSAVERPKATFAGKSLYPTIYFQAAAMIQSLIMNHPFNDGNKRTGFFTMLRFLNINGIDCNVAQEEIIKFTIEIDTRKFTIEEISSWIEKHAKK